MRNHVRDLQTSVNLKSSKDLQNSKEKERERRRENMSEKVKDLVCGMEIEKDSAQGPVEPMEYMTKE